MLIHGDTEREILGIAGRHEKKTDYGLVGEQTGCQLKKLRPEQGTK